MPQRLRRTRISVAFPVLDSQARHAPEFGDIVGDERCIVGSGDCRDHEIVRTDRFSLHMKVGPDQPVMLGAGIVERQAGQGREESRQPPQVFIHPRASSGTEQEFRLDHAAKRDLRG